MIKRVGSPRRHALKTPHHGLLPEDQLWFFLERARHMADRTGSYCCLLAITIEEGQESAESLTVLTQVLRDRLRITDDKGFLKDGRIGVVLPETPEEGAHVVGRDVQRLFREAGFGLTYVVYVYPADFSQVDELLDVNESFDAEEEEVAEELTDGESATVLRWTGCSLWRCRCGSGCWTSRARWRCWLRPRRSCC